MKKTRRQTLARTHTHGGGGVDVVGWAAPQPGCRFTVTMRGTERAEIQPIRSSSASACSEHAALSGSGGGGGGGGIVWRPPDLWCCSPPGAAPRSQCRRFCSSRTPRRRLLSPWWSYWGRRKRRKRRGKKGEEREEIGKRWEEGDLQKAEKRETERRRFFSHQKRGDARSFFHVLETRRKKTSWG